MTAPIPHSLFVTDALPAPERFEVWRESLLPLFEALPGQVAPADFRARVDGYNLQQLFFCRTAFTEQRYRRLRGHNADDGADHLLVQLYLEGGYQGHNGHREVCVRPGDISLLDLGRPLATEAAASDTLSLVVPRELMFGYARTEQLAYGSVLRAGSPLARILGQHMRTVWASLSSAGAEDVPAINHMLIAAAAGAFARSGAVGEHAREACAGATLTAVRGYIDAHLAEPLTPARLCRQFGCSRSQLYRLFQPLGGIAAYIRDARLQRCLEELTYSGRRSRIVDVAMRWGFSSQSHFCRLFRAAFGITPGEAAERGYALASSQPGPHGRATPDFHHWLRQL